MTQGVAYFTYIFILYYYKVFKLLATSQEKPLVGIAPRAFYFDFMQNGLYSVFQKDSSAQEEHRADCLEIN